MPDKYRKMMSPFFYAAVLLSGSYLGTSHAGEANDAVTQGRLRYFQSCVICHGEDAKGTGIMAEMLKVKSADLTVLTRNNNGEFPFERVYETIDGRDMPQAHGVRDMPVWGKIWEEETSCSPADTFVRGRILEIILYLRSIQE